MFNKTTIARFWGKVSRAESSACWNWTASKRHKGYGAFVWADTSGAVVQGRAHRFSWELHNGPIGDGVCVLHKCDNPACVNPAHLFLGSKRDNYFDMLAKGRRKVGGTTTPKNICAYQRGEAHHSRLLTDNKVRLIRKARGKGASFSAIAMAFGIGLTTAYKVCKKISWSHVV